MLAKCPSTGLLLPREHIDQKQALKKLIDEWVEKAVNANQHLTHTYFLVFHAKFDPYEDNAFKVDAPLVTDKLPPFVTNQMVFYVNNRLGLCELLWIVPPKKKDGKLKVEFNKEGVAYLQAKGAMPSQPAKTA